MADVNAAEKLQSRLRANGDCLEFIVRSGTTGVRGYGGIHFDGRRMPAHRLAWELAHGPIPPGMCVCHRCDNPPCCNPEHLFLGTVADNNADRHAKGRTVMPTNGPDFFRNKTHCKQGHPFDEANTYRAPSGQRMCRTCHRAAWHRWNNKRARLQVVA